MGGETRRGEVKEENGVKVELVLGGGWRRGGWWRQERGIGRDEM